MKIYFLTIAVCTKNPNSLEDCLSSVSDTGYLQKEILVVDSSDPNIREQIEEIVHLYGCRYIYEPKPGLSAARNRAIAESKGDIIAFTDDDCVVDEKWAENLIKNFSKSDVMCVTGRTLPLKGVDGQLFEKFMSQDKGPNKRIFSVTSSPLKILHLFSIAFESSSLKERGPIPWCIGAGNNMAFKKEIFKPVGLFDESLGVGTPQMGGEDMDMFFRIFYCGHKIVYEPEAIVYHRHRTRIDGYMDGRGTGCFFKKHLNNRYILIQLLGRFFNRVYCILVKLFERDKCYCYILIRDLIGLISSRNYSP